MLFKCLLKQVNMVIMFYIYLLFKYDVQLQMELILMENKIIVIFQQLFIGQGKSRNVSD